MLRLLKILLITVVSLVLLVVVGLFALTQFIDPNDFKPQIEQLAKEEANIALDIEGDLAWTFWPSLGISIGKTEARIGDDTDLFAGIDQVQASVAVWPLLSGNVRVNGILVDGLKLHLAQTADGANWERIAAGSETEEETPVEEASDAPLEIPVVIPEISIKNGLVTFFDETDHTHIELSNISLSAHDVNLKETTPFPLSAALRFQDPETRIDLNLDAQVSLDLNQDRYQLTPMILHAIVAGVTPEPVTVHLEQSVDADMAKGVVTLTNMVLTAAGVTTKGQVTVSGLNNDQLMLAGRLNVAEFNANSALQTIGEQPIETTDSKALSRVSVDITLDGPANSVMINPLVITLDDSTIKGTAGLANLETGKIVFDLAMDKIVLDGYMPPSDESEEGNAGEMTLTGGDAQVSQEAKQPLSTEPLFLPDDIQAIRELLLEGKFTLGEMHLEKIRGSNIQLDVLAKQGKVTVNTKGGLLEGDYALSSLFDVSASQPKMSAKGQLTHIQIAPLVEMALNDKLLSGLITTHFEGGATGNSEKDLMESATATFDLKLANTVLHGVSLHSAIESGLANHKDLLQMAIGERELPRALREDSNIVGLTADGALKDQVVRINNIQSEMDEGRVAGKGWLNINNDDFEFILTMQSPHFSDSPYLKGAEWPIRCAGNLDGNPARWCGPDTKGIDKIANQALANAAKKKLADKLGIESDADNMKDLAKDAAKQKAEEEKKKAEEKAKEKAKDKLKGLFK